MKTKSLILFLLVLVTQAACAQWTSANNGIPPKTTVQCLARKNSTIFMGAYGGIYISQDNGASWQFKKIETEYTPAFYSFSVEDQRVIAAGNSVCAISTDEGVTWKLMTLDKDLSSVTGIMSKGNELYVQTGKGLFITDNNGRNAKLITGSLKDHTYVDEDGDTYKLNSVYGVALLPDAIMIGTATGMMISKDKGWKWEPLNNGMPKGKIVNKLFLDHGTIYTTSEDAGSYCSTNNGASWTKIEGGMPKKAYITAMAFSGETIFAAVYEKGVFSSTDGGKTWLEMNEGFAKKEKVYTLLLDGKKLYGGLYDKGVYTCDVSKFVK